MKYSRFHLLAGMALHRNAKIPFMAFACWAKVREQMGGACYGRDNSGIGNCRGAGSDGDRKSKVQSFFGQAV